jgi:hypothetical protein
MATAKSFFSLPLADYNTSFDNREAFQTYGTYDHQISLIKDMNNKFEDLSGSILSYNIKNADLVDNYKDFSYNSVNVGRQGIWLDKEHSRPDVTDGVKEDIHIMIMEQNNAYIIGMITLATVLITTYLVIKK